ncbi:helix-turn-helix domain-containing protein [Paenibacillus rhizoplanae]
MEEYLKQTALTITQFAKRSQLHSGTLSNIINGHRPIAMQQLDRITRAMGQEEGFFYDLYITNYIIEGSTDWRRVGPLLLRCAELDKLDSIRRIARHVMDNLMYAPLLFDTAEELFNAGKKRRLLPQSTRLSPRPNDSSIQSGWRSAITGCLLFRLAMIRTETCGWPTSLNLSLSAWTK